MVGSVELKPAPVGVAPAAVDEQTRSVVLHGHPS